MGRIVLRGKVLAVCADGDDVIVATDAALHRIDRRGRIEPITPLATNHTLDLVVTETTIFWTEPVHPMQSAHRRRACAVAREGGAVRRLTGELSWTGGLVRVRDAVLGITLRELLRFDLDGNPLDEFDFADWRQLSAIAGGISYEVKKEGLIRTTPPSFWDWLLGRC